MTVTPPGSHVHRVAPLFARHETLPAIVEAALEGVLGTVASDDGEHPRVARLSLGCYEIFGGDPAAPMAVDLARAVGGEKELVFNNDPAWRALLLELFGPRVTDRPMEAFDGGGLDEDRLRSLAGVAPAGYALRRLDAPSAQQLDPELQPHALQVFASAEDFVSRGLGFGLFEGGVLASAATSYTVSERRVEVAIATRPAFRGRGLATAVAARLLVHCLETGRAPCWNASNPISIRIARQLGFRRAGLCQVLWLR